MNARNNFLRFCQRQSSMAAPSPSQMRAFSARPSAAALNWCNLDESEFGSPQWTQWKVLAILNPEVLPSGEIRYIPLKSANAEIRMFLEEQSRLGYQVGSKKFFWKWN